jgi:hypothetical protein
MLPAQCHQLNDISFVVPLSLSHLGNIVGEKESGLVTSLHYMGLLCPAHMLVSLRFASYFIPHLSVTAGQHCG